MVVPLVITRRGGEVAVLEAVREARRLVEAGVVRGLKLQNETVFFDFLDRSSPERR